MAKTYPGIYLYDPSFGAAIAGIIVFLILSIIHTFQLFRTRTWFFIPFAVGGWFEVVGYIGRAISVKQKPNYTIAPWAVNNIPVLIAPALFAASIYMLLGRIIKMTDGEKYAIVRRTWLTKIFVFGDIISFLAQAAGASILANRTEKSIKNGQNIIKFGLGLQIVFFVIFLITATIFHIRIWHRPTPAASDRSIPWRKHMYPLYFASKLILTRCAYRLAEYEQASSAVKNGGTTIKGYLLEHEWAFYVLDALLMAIVMLTFAIIHPSQVNAVLNDDGLYMNKIFMTREYGYHGHNVGMNGYGADTETINGGYGNGHSSIGAPTGVRKDGVAVDNGMQRPAAAYPVPANPRY